ncbi:gamma-mobile-trio protein GmtX [Vibrio sp. Vb2535]|uniref:gamma-mobile-trio protein GmtX n=1 Tax=Vibrio sp. Vb2535 TaxID=3074667 RepID=UPI002964D675|nr:gamma-mobile-trio protein GmtX [Vibrio sp. Vb2535]MDW1753565.1 gamma-mobile-trio protein GmtX [Vibrio sp. Vb2535]
MDIDVNAILDTLKDGKSAKTQASLDKLNETLSNYYAEGKRDFSITTMGRVSAEAGGVGYNSIRATANKHYRDLIEAWAAKAQTTTKKPPSTKPRASGQDYKLLERIDDTAVRALFGQIIRERDRYKSEANMLKNQTKIIIDKRPVSAPLAPSESAVELLPSLTGICSDNEIKALRTVCSDEWLEKLAFNANDLGQVKDEYGTEILPRGFLTGLRKLLGEVDE